MWQMVKPRKYQSFFFIVCTSLTLPVISISRWVVTNNHEINQSNDDDNQEERRSHRRICLFRAMHFPEVKAPLSDFVVPNKKQTGTRWHNLQYRIEHHKTKAHMSTFFICTSKEDWNKLDLQDRLLCSPG